MVHILRLDHFLIVGEGSGELVGASTMHHRKAGGVPERGILE